MINNILNNLKSLFKKEETVSKSPSLYKAKVKLELCYIEGEFNPKYSLPKYITSTKVELDDSEDFQNAIDKIYLEYLEIITDIKKQLEDSSCDYIQVKNRLLINKKDFVNVVIINENQ